MPSSLSHLLPFCPLPADWKFVYMIVPSGTDSDCTKAEAQVLVDSIFLQKMSFVPIIINARIYLKHVINVIISAERRNGTEIVKRD